MANANVCECVHCICKMVSSHLIKLDLVNSKRKYVGWVVAVAIAVAAAAAAAATVAAAIIVAVAAAYTTQWIITDSINCWSEK